MKQRTISILFLAMLSLGSFGQMTLLDSKGGVSIRGYAGVLAGSSFSVDTFHTAGFASVRVGGEITWKPKDWVALYGLGAAEMDQRKTFATFSLLRVAFIPSEKCTIAVGKIPTPLTEIRPIPTTGDGQFELWTQSRIPGSAVGGKVTYVPRDRYSLVAGGFWRNTQASFEMGFKMQGVRKWFSYIHGGGYYLAKEKTGGAALETSFKYVSQTAVYSDKGVLASLTVIEIPGLPDLFLYSDMGMDTQEEWKVIRGEWGVFKEFSFEKYLKPSLKNVGAIMGIAYVHETRSVNGYVFFHL